MELSSNCRDDWREDTEEARDEAILEIFKEGDDVSLTPFKEQV